MPLERGDIDIISEAFKRAMKDGGPSMPSAPSVPGGAPPSQWTKTLDAVGGELLGLGKAATGIASEGFGKMLQGGVKVSDGFNIVSQNLIASDSHIGKALGGIAKVGGNIVTSLEDTITTLDGLSNTGASFGNSLVELRMASAGTRLPLREFSEVIAKNSTAFAKLPGGVNEGAKLFAKASEEMFDKSGLIDNLTKMGYTSTDLNSILSYTISQQKRLNLNDAEATANAIKQAESLAFEMDAIAKITGKSRKEQEDELRKQKENGQVRAAVDLALRKGGEGVKTAFDSMTAASKIAGPDFAKLQEQMFAMGRPSKDMAEKFAMAGGEAQRLMKASADAAKRGDEATAKRLTQEAAIAYAANQRSEAMMTLASQGNQSAIESNQNVAAFSDRMAATAKELKVDLNTREGQRKVLEKINADTAKEQKSNGDGVTRTTKAVTNNLNDLSAGVQKATYGQLQNNKVIGKAFDDYYKTLDAAKGKDNKIRAEAEQKTDKALTNLLGMISDQRPDSKSMIDAIQKGLAESKERGTGLTADSAEMRGLLAFLKNDKSKDALMATMEKQAKAQNMDTNKYLQNILAQGPGATKQLVDAALSESNRRTAEEQRKARQTPGESRLEDVQNRRRKKEEAAAEEADGGGDTVSSLMRLATGDQGLNVRVLSMPGMPQRQNGSVGSVGKLIEDFGSGTMAMLHGKETVMTENQLANLAKGISKMNMAEVPQPTKKADTPSDTTAINSGTATLNDLNTSLQSLNMLMAQMLSSTNNMVDNTKRQIKATKGLNGNIYAR